MDTATVHNDVVSTKLFLRVSTMFVQFFYHAPLSWVVQSECTFIVTCNVSPTVEFSFSISIPSWLRNLLPMLMKVSLPICCIWASPSKINFTSGFLLSVTRTASDVCRASLFFSMNWVFNTHAHTRRQLRHRIKIAQLDREIVFIYSIVGLYNVDFVTKYAIDELNIIGLNVRLVNT